MIQLAPHFNIYVYVKSVDFRLGIDGLAGLCRSIIKTDPMSGSLYLFTNRRKTGIKLLVYDGQGYCLFYKRLSAGKFNYWPKDNKTLSAPQLQVLLYNGNPAGSNFASEWRPIRS
jgi:transposase